MSNFTFTFHFHALEKEMATNSSVLAWRIPGTGEPGGLPSMGSHRVGHDLSDLEAAAADQVCRPICKMGKENLLIRSGIAGTNLNGRKKYNKYYYFINTHKSFILFLFPYGRETASD